MCVPFRNLHFKSFYFYLKNERLYSLLRESQTVTSEWAVSTHVSSVSPSIHPPTHPPIHPSSLLLLASELLGQAVPDSNPLFVMLEHLGGLRQKGYREKCLVLLSPSLSPSLVHSFFTFIHSTKFCSIPAALLLGSQPGPGLK